MRNKQFISFLIIAITLGCTQSKSPDTLKTNSFWKSELERMEELLPRKYNSKDYYLIFRIGSIEFSSECTVFCIPKDQLRSKTIACAYFSINGMYDSNIQKIIEPTIIGHQLILANKYYTSEVNLNKLQGIDFSTFDAVWNSKPKERKGEWHCGNLYVINPNSKTPLLLDYNSGKTEKDFFVSLYQQISPSEYFQCTALTESCEDRQDLIVWLQTPQANDSLQFKISNADWYLPGWND